VEKEPKIPARPRATPIRILAVGALAALVVFAAVPLLRAVRTPVPSPALPQLIQGGFRPNSNQISQPDFERRGDTAISRTSRS